MTLTALTQFLEARKVPYVLIGTKPTGRALLIEEGARILAAYGPESEENIFWNHPDLANCESRSALSSVGVGGMGGLRLWQAPEESYMWNGRPDTAGFSNYEVQPGCDPGNYTLEKTSDQRCVITGDAQLQDYRSGQQISFKVRRIIEICPLASAYKEPGVAGFRLRLQNSLTLTAATSSDSRLDLWHLLQLPVPSKAGAFVTPHAQPEIYFNPQKADGYDLADGRFTWQTNGQRMAKVGFSAESITQGLFGLLQRPASTGVYLWDIPLSPGDDYVDSPLGTNLTNQAVQFWDGFGFCEVEYHSRGVSPASPETFDTSELTYLEVQHGSGSSLRELTRLPIT